MRTSSLVVLVGLIALACKPSAGHATLTVDADAGAGGHVISPLLFGDQVESADSTAFWDADAGAPYAGTLALAQSAGIKLLRYPGGTPGDFFHWEEVIGPLSSRTPQINPFASTATEVLRQPVDFGPDEAASAAAAMGAQLLITANAGTGTPDEAARWLAHYQDAGVPAPYWEIGNEIWIGGDSYGAAVPRKTATEYAALFDQFARALRAVDPSVKVGVLGCHDSGAFALCADPHWNQTVFSAVTEKFDFVAIHNSYAPAYAAPFVSGDSDRLFRATLAAPEYIAANFALQEKDLASFAPELNKAAPFAVTEHASFFVPVMDATFTKQLERNRALASALFSAASFNLFLSDPHIAIANHLKLASPYWQAPVTTSGADGFSSPVLSAYGYVFKAYSEAGGGTFLPVHLDCDVTFDADEVGIVPAQQKVPALHVAAVVPPSGTDRLWLYVVNRDLSRDVVATLSIANLSVQGVVAEVLDGPESYSLASPEHPDGVTFTSQDLGAASRVTFPAHSFTRLRLR